LALLVLLGLTVHSLAPQLVPRAGRLIRESPAIMENVYSGDIAVSMGQRNGWDEAQSQRAKAFLQQRREAIRGVVESVRQFVSVVFGGLLLIPILAMFFLSGGENLANGVIRLLSTKETYGEARALAADLNNMLRHYIRAKVILAVLSLAYCSIAMLFLGYRHALALGLMAGLLEFIPVVGWITALTIIATGGFIMHAHWIWMAALLGLWRVTMDYWIAPRVMGHELEIHPLLAIFAVMVGGAVGGIVGIYLSVPIVAALGVVWRRFFPTEPENASEISRAIGPP
jgi:predicted PurR-regulated permease PerM